ncbi:unnamed protein product [Camellia sinensis]
MAFGVDLWIVYIFVYGGHLTLCIILLIMSSSAFMNISIIGTYNVCNPTDSCWRGI